MQYSWDGGACKKCGEHTSCVYRDGFLCMQCRIEALPPKTCGFCGVQYKGYCSQRCVPCTQALYVFWKVASGRRLAQQAVQREVRARRLPPAKSLKCTDCLAQATEYDHRDYSKPIDVEPVCRRCNLRRGHAIPKAWSFEEFMVQHVQRPSIRIKDLDYLRMVFERLCPRSALVAAAQEAA